MTSPVETIKVACPACGVNYEDWTRGSVNLDLEGWDPADPEVAAYRRERETAKCPSCRQVVELETLTVEGGVWRFASGRSGDVESEVECMAECQEATRSPGPVFGMASSFLS
jgi:hypothetical protein